VARKPVRAELALGLLFAINLLNFYDRHILGAVTEPIRREWGLTDTQLGWLGAAFILLYAAVGVPFGRLADRFSRKALLTAGLFFWSVLTALSGAAAGFWSLFATRLGMGIGEAVCAPVASSLIGDLYPASRRSWAMSVFMLGLPAGAALSFFGTGAIAYSFGWRAAFFVAGAPGCILALLIRKLLADPPRGAAETVNVGARRRAGSAFLVVLKIPTMWWIIISGALHNFNMYALAQFLPSFLIRSHGLDLRRAGFVSGVIFGAAGAAGLLLGGRLADYLARSRANARLWLGAVCLFAAVPLSLAALGQQSGSPYRFLLWMLPGCALLYVYYSVVYSSIHDVIEPSLRGTAMAIYFLAMYALGGAAGPVVTGKASDLLARRAARAAALSETARAAGLHQAMYLIPALELLTGVVLYLGSRTVVRDQRNLAEWMAGAAQPVVR
jgi:MFS family permease